ncbi:MAG: MFS transporter, partial [Streptosporangiales bacterium]|nr:MFS transporter [Streptosporangiales bacterium]
MPDESRHHWWVLSVTSLGVLLTGLNTSTLAVALPVVSRHFRATATQASWLLLSYMLVTTVLILSFGRVADIIGRRQMYVGGLGLFTLASLLAGFSPNATVLVGVRAVQAIGAAAIITNTTALLTDVFPARQLTLG